MGLERYKQVINEDFSRDADHIDSIIKNFGLSKDSKILDIGTGLGAMSILLAMNDFDVLTGQPEKDPEWDQHKEHHCEHHHPEHESQHHENSSLDWRENAGAVGVEDKITFQHLDAVQLIFPDESFDGVFMYDSLQHIKNRKAALTECLRVMKPQGLMCIIEWNKKSIKADEEKYGFKIDYIDPRKILDRDDLSFELIPGNWVNVFILRKQF
jgi:SAM-dependent methyltransferase